MTRKSFAATLAMVAVLAGGGTWGAARLRAAEALPPVAEPAEADLATRNADIELFAARAERDPFSALDRARLASLYIQRSRETGDFQDVLRAEIEARASLKLRTTRNATAMVVLAGSLVAQHRFAEARVTAEALVAMEPERPSYRALLGEVRMEQGDYPAARASFESLYLQRYTVAVAPRAARWEELRGQVGKARQLLAAARREAVARGDLPREQVAWFHMRAGDVELRAGRFRAADAAYRTGLEANPEDHRLLAGLARVESANGRWDRALELYERSVARVLDPTVLAEMSDVAEAMGDSARAAGYARVAEVAARRQGGTVHRAWSLYLLDQGRDVNAIAASAATDVRTRPDVYGYDLLAWALYRRGNPAEARAASARALRLGTPDAALYFHAGMIERALGNDRGAARLLERALRINPAFHPRHAGEARAVLDSIAGG